MAARRIETEQRSLWVELAGSQVRLVQGQRYVTRVIEAGAGDPLILIHGVGSHAEIFARNIMRLAARFHVYAIDALYHGYSTKEPYDAENRISRQAEAVIDFMNAEGLPWAHIEGESMGSGIAFELGMRFPDRCGKIVLNSGSFYIKYKRRFGGESGGGDSLMARCRDSVLNLSPETVRRRMEFLVAKPERITDELVDLEMKLYSDPAIRESMMRVYGITAPRGNLGLYEEEEAVTLKPPVLVLWTPGAGLEVGQYLANLLPGAKYHLIEDAGHWPQWEHPEEHDLAVLDFLAG